MPAPLKSYIDRILNVLAEIDDLGSDKKEIYKELAGDGYDRSVVSQVVGHIRKKAAKPGKFAEQATLFDLYLTEYEGVGTVNANAHAAREQFPEHDADGVITEPDALMRPQTEASSAAGARNVSAGRASVESPATNSDQNAEAVQ
jgi:uncharacterized protein (UPF0335 family)